jgi:YegS/Rv2252/BmrU family lipid kinase
MPKDGAGEPRGNKARKARKKAAASEKKAPPNPNAGRAMLIVNPVAGAGAGLKMWDELQAALKDLALDYDHVFTERIGHAIELAKEAAESGYSTVVVVGGDGTIFEVTNGLMAVERPRRPVMGVIPCGRGSDYCRTLEIPQDWRIAASMLLSGKKRTVDVGWMEYVNHDGKPVEGYFANIAGLGFDGEVTERANNMPERTTKVLGGTYLASLLITYARFREKDVELHIDSEAHRVLATTVVIANCQYFGGKMRIAPDAVCDDGLFDIVVIGSGFGSPVLDLPPESPVPEHSWLDRAMAKVKMAGNIPKIYKGSHVKIESVETWRGRKVKVLSDDRMVLQADGEVIGTGPFQAELIPDALDVIA